MVTQLLADQDIGEWKNWDFSIPEGPCKLKTQVVQNKVWVDL